MFYTLFFISFIFSFLSSFFSVKFQIPYLLSPFFNVKLYLHVCLSNIFFPFPRVFLSFSFLCLKKWNILTETASSESDCLSNRNYGFEPCIRFPSIININSTRWIHAARVTNIDMTASKSNSNFRVTVLWWAMKVMITNFQTIY